MPQLFLYEEARNRFLVIDGQQRLMSIYYFIKQRFPRKEARPALRAIFEEHGGIPDEVLHDDQYFTKFRLKLPAKLPGQPNRFSGLSYATLGENKLQLDLRPIRNVIIKQNSPTDDDSSIYEIFSRLNSGGVNLTPQEIRLSLYHSVFYDMLMHVNTDREWRRLLGSATPDLHLKDVEILLRIIAMLVSRVDYAPSMIKFLNQFSKKAQSHNAEQNALLQSLLTSFLATAGDVPDDVFINRRNNRLNIALIEAVFVAVCDQAFEERRGVTGQLDPDEIRALAEDEEFLQAAARGTTQTANVHKRLQRAVALVSAL